jgi:hypothetical protein
MTDHIDYFFAVRMATRDCRHKDGFNRDHSYFARFACLMKSISFPGAVR